MNIAQIFLAELKHETNTTLKFLERTPLSTHAQYQPHPKSMTLQRLAAHVAELPAWIDVTINQTELDFATSNYKPILPATTAELIELLHQNTKKATEALQNTTNEALYEKWTMRSGEQIFFTLPRTIVLRNMCFNHLIHHRAQLGLYLRLLDIPLPGTYGPSADEQ